MPFWEGVVTGALTADEYATLACAFGFGFVYLLIGVGVSLTARPRYVGHLLWMTGLSAVLSLYPVAKYYETLQVTRGMIFSAVAGFSALLLAVAYGFFSLEQPDSAEAIWCLDAFLWYFLLLFAADKVGQASLAGTRKTEARTSLAEEAASSKRRARQIKEAVAVSVVMVLFVVQLRVWISYYAALCFAIAWFALVSVLCWWAASHDLYVSTASMRRVERLSLAGSLVLVAVVLRGTFKPGEAAALLTISGAMLCQLVRQAFRVLTVWPHEQLVWYSRTVLPAMGYEPLTHRLVDRSSLVTECVGLGLWGLAWGGVVAALVQPVSLGVGISCVFLTAAAVLVVLAASSVLTELGSAAKFAAPEIFVQAAATATEIFIREARRDADVYHSDSSDEESDSDDDEDTETTVMTHLLASVDADDDEDDSDVSDDVSDEDDEEDEMVVAAVSSLYDDDAATYGEATVASRQVEEVKELRSSSKVKKFPHTNSAELAEELTALRLERARVDDDSAIVGPFGWFGLAALKAGRCLRPPRRREVVMISASVAPVEEEDDDDDDEEQEEEEEEERPAAAAAAAAAVETTTADESTTPCLAPPRFRDRLTALAEVEAKFDLHFSRELECVARFQLLAMSSAEGQLEHELLILAKFLKEKRFKLLAQRLMPPKSAGGGRGRVDLVKLATWLYSQSEEQRIRFRRLHRDFKKTETKREQLLDLYDAKFEKAARKLRRERHKQEEWYSKKSVEAALGRRLARRERWLAAQAATQAENGAKTQAAGDIAKLTRAEIIDPKLLAAWDRGEDGDGDDDELKESYTKAVLLGGGSSEFVRDVRCVLDELETGERDCVPAVNSNGLRFLDPEFPPGPTSLGLCSGAAAVGVWRSAGDLKETPLFLGASDPEDVRPGVLVNDDWFLSALSMLSAAGGNIADSGEVDAQIKRLFLRRMSAAQTPIEHSAVGAVAVRLFARGRWEAVVLDDQLPMLGDGSQRDALRALRKTGGTPADVELCGGVAVAHAERQRELWVSMLEKAVAKFYGSYAEMEKGFVHLGLELFTGFRSECVAIASARGAGRNALWLRLLRYHRNEYVVGCGTVESRGASAAVRDLGLKLDGGCYSICDVAELRGGKRLLRLRAPPGYSVKFKGNDGEKWSPRVRAVLSGDDDDDDEGSFWCPFADFCAAFRCLYVCHYHSARSRRWRRSVLEGQWTGGGSPSWILRVHRPITLRLDLRQCDSQGRAAHVAHRVAAYLSRVSDDPLYYCTEVGDPPTEVSLASLVARSRTPPNADPRTSSCVVDQLPVGAYVVMASTTEPGVEAHFEISLTTDFEIDVDQLWPRLSFEDRSRLLLTQLAHGDGEAVSPAHDDAHDDAHDHDLEEKRTSSFFRPGISRFSRKKEPAPEPPVEKDA